MYTYAYKNHFAAHNQIIETGFTYKVLIDLLYCSCYNTKKKSATFSLHHIIDDITSKSDYCLPGEVLQHCSWSAGPCIPQPLHYFGSMVHLD